MTTNYEKIYKTKEEVICYGCGEVCHSFKYGLTGEGPMPFCLDCCNAKN